MFLTAAYKELFILPFMVDILCFMWMKLVHVEIKLIEELPNKTKKSISVYASYQDALANKVDSGTEIDSPNEDKGEQDQANTDETHKKNN